MPRIGKKHTEEAKRKISEANKKRRRWETGITVPSLSSLPIGVTPAQAIADRKLLMAVKREWGLA